MPPKRAPLTGGPSKSDSLGMVNRSNELSTRLLLGEGEDSLRVLLALAGRVFSFFSDADIFECPLLFLGCCLIVRLLLTLFKPFAFVRWGVFGFDLLFGTLTLAFLLDTGGLDFGLPLLTEELEVAAGFFVTLVLFTLLVLELTFLDTTGFFAVTDFLTEEAGDFLVTADFFTVADLFAVMGFFTVAGFLATIGLGLAMGFFTVAGFLANIGLGLAMGFLTFAGFLATIGLGLAF